MFRDSLQFLTCSLDSLVKSLAKTRQQNFGLFHDTIRNFYPESTDEMIQLVKQKGVICYDYIDKFERLDEIALPPREQFYNRLVGEDCSEADYTPSQRVMRDFKFQLIGDYIRLYLMSDIALLPDVFQMFRYN